MKLSYQSKEALKMFPQLRAWKLRDCCHPLGVQLTLAGTDLMSCENEGGIFCCREGKLFRAQGEVVFPAYLEEQLEFLVELVYAWRMAKEVIDLPDHHEIGEVVEDGPHSLVELVRGGRKSHTQPCH